MIQNYGCGPLIALVRGTRVALAGQPNVGKSTVFNLLTGLSQHVGNWPGKSVEQKIGMYRMIDVARQQGIRIEPHVLEAALRVPVVPLVATRNQGVRELMDAVEQLVRSPTVRAPSRPTIRADHQAVLDEIRKVVAGFVPEPYPEDWVALKLLEGDEEITRMMREQLLPERWECVHAILISSFCDEGTVELYHSVAFDLITDQVIELAQLTDLEPSLYQERS